MLRYPKYPAGSLFQPRDIRKPQWDANTSVKVMVAFGPQTFHLLEDEAKERGVSVQELLRAVIIPEWFRTQGNGIPRNHNNGPRVTSNART